MEKIAFISGETIYYWSSIVLTLATLTAICFFWSLYLGKGGNGVAAFSVIPLAIALSLLLGRLVHWYCRTSSYDSFEAAMKPFSPGGYALLGVFAGCVLAAVVIRLLHFDRNLPQMLDCMAVAGCAGIAVGRLACFFNSTDRGQIITSTQSLPWVYPVTNAVSGATEYRPGAVLCNLFWADELNRATSRTQSALLEAMEEGQVTVDGTAHPVPQPFLVIATQNPAGASGTQLLPDSQLDRFMVRLSIGYPTASDEADMVRRKQSGNPLERVEQVLDLDGLNALRAQADAVHVSDPVLDYIVRLVGATREHPMLLQGASPRATLAVTAMAKAAALVLGRDYVNPEDVRTVFSDVVSHRLIRSPRAQQDGRCDPAGDVLKVVPAPRVK